MSGKLMILGAGTGQLPIIQKAVELGATVITVDYLPDNVGHKFSHQSVNCSTVEKEAVLGVARDLAIDGIVTFASDVATMTVSYVAEQLGLPGTPYQTALTMSNKARFRHFQQTQPQLSTPRYVTGQKFGEVYAALTDLTLPLMFKPVDTSGSRGVRRIDSLDREACAAAFEFAQSYSRTRIVCVEEFIEGIDVSGDGFLVDGELFAVITRKFKKDFVPIGHSLPSNLSLSDQQRVLAEVAATCRAVGHCTGPLDFDVIGSPQKVTVVEMSPRLGGNGIPKLIQRASGVDLIGLTVCAALGEQVALPAPPTMLRSCGSWVFGSERAGQLRSLASPGELRCKVREVFDFVLNAHEGDEVAEFIHSGESLGTVLFDCTEPCDYHAMQERIRQALRIQVE